MTDKRWRIETFRRNGVRAGDLFYLYQRYMSSNMYFSRSIIIDRPLRGVHHARTDCFGFPLLARVAFNILPWPRQTILLVNGRPPGQ